MAGKDRGGEGMSRRAFLRAGAAGAVGAGLSGRGLLAAGAGRPFAAADPKARIVLVRDAKAVGEDGNVNAEVVARILREAMGRFAGEEDPKRAWAKYFKPGDRVGIKFSRCGWMRVPTEQAVIDATSAGLRSIGIPAGAIRAADSGLEPEKRTALLNIASVKAHSLVGFAASIKNYISFGKNRPRFHHKGRGKLGENWHLPAVKGKTRLVIIDFLRPYFGRGPEIDPRYRWRFGGLVVGTDPVALDVLARTIIERKRAAFRAKPWPLQPPADYLEAADREYGLGVSDPRRIRVERLGWKADEEDWAA